ncbi:unnamed protein product [Lactuca virosa]|uniref:Uncharacterized protein n=1 Tax=Lactuca virosa TaxID=75947 RepID=A0AAU9MLU4_9ASTR|nr:unnamed protein product [Lactuca virosa]
MLAYHRRSFGDGNPQPLINLVRRYYNNGLEELIDPLIRDQIDSRCFHIFKELAYQCISYNVKERPTMETVIERIEDAMDFQVDGFNGGDGDFQSFSIVPLCELLPYFKFFGLTNRLSKEFGIRFVFSFKNPYERLVYDLRFLELLRKLVLQILLVVVKGDGGGRSEEENHRSEAEIVDLEPTETCGSDGDGSWAVGGGGGSPTVEGSGKQGWWLGGGIASKVIDTIDNFCNFLKKKIVPDVQASQPTTIVSRVDVAIMDDEIDSII